MMYVYFGLGTNLGDKEHNLRLAVRLLRFGERHLELLFLLDQLVDHIAVHAHETLLLAILARGKETQEHKHPARKRRQDMEI